MLIVRNPRHFDTFDRMFEQLTSGLTGSPAPRSTAPAVRADWHEGSLVLTVDLPGVPLEAVKVEVAEHALTIAVEQADDRGDIRWSRTMQLGGSLDTDAVGARYADGRLTVTVPPAAKPQPRSIVIDGPADLAAPADDSPAAIEASAEG